MKRIQVGDLSMALGDSGSGLPVVLVHGFPLNRSLWVRQRRRLKGFRVVVPDLRGFGGTTAAPPFSVPRYAADLTGMLDRLGIERAVFCGLSMGGYVVFELLRQAPVRVSALILISTKASADDESGKLSRNRLIHDIGSRGYAAVHEAMLPRLMAQESVDRRPSALVEVSRMIDSVSPAGMIGALEAMRDRRDSTDLLHRIGVPTLVVAADKDPITPPSVMQEMAAGIPDARFAMVHDAGHLSPIERPRRVNDLMAEFLQSL